MTGTADELAVEDFSQRGAAAADRKVYGETLLALARADPRIVCLTADLTLPTETDLFRDALPERFLQVGIAEANMIGVAAGMARCGEVPFVHSFCVFATRRCYDQIAMQVAYPRQNVKIVGVIPGLTTVLGVSHQATDDLALMRALPNMTVIEPRGPAAVPGAVRAAAAHDGPVYLRLKRAEAGDGAVAGDPDAFAIGRASMLREPGEGLLLACGLMVGEALRAADMLAAEGIRVGVLDVPTLKPIDPAIAALAARCRAVVTAENHSVIGGLGSAVAELLMEAGVRTGFARVGVRDVFAEGGSTPYLFARYGLTAREIAAAYRRASRRSSL